jgi:hypothetical protein
VGELSLLWALAVCSAGCASNPYGYAPEYVPLSEEESYFERGDALSYEEVRRDPTAYEQETVGWFGVVEEMTPIGADGQVRVALNQHFHQERHLCTDQFDSSCRVTISEKSGGPFSALLTLRPEDRSDRDRVYVGSMLKIYGKPIPDYDERGGPVIKTQYYRHWPLGTYVTTGRRVNRRR